MNPLTTGSSEVLTSSGVPTKRMWPLWSRAMWSAMTYALSMSWVTTTPVTPSSSRMRRMSRLITVVVLGSSPVVGSSYRRYLGRVAIARAMPARFRCPPEISDGYRFSSPGEIDKREAFADPVADLGLLHSRYAPQPHADILGERHRIEESRKLKYVPRFATQPRRARPGPATRRSFHRQSRSRVPASATPRCASTRQTCPLRTPRSAPACRHRSRRNLHRSGPTWIRTPCVDRGFRCS